MFCLKSQYIFLWYCMNILYFSVLISVIVYYIYETNVVWEYINKLSDLSPSKLKKFINSKLLVKAYPNSGVDNYIAFMNQTYNSFFTRLISCPVCAGFWICLIFGLLTGISNVPYYIFLSLFFYLTLKILTNISGKL